MTKDAGGFVDWADQQVRKSEVVTPIGPDGNKFFVLTSGTPIDTLPASTTEAGMAKGGVGSGIRGHTTERAWDLAINEGGDGYNPHREKRELAEMAAHANHKRGKMDVLRDLERQDNSIARESGTFDQNRVAALHAELADFDAAEDSELESQWPLDETLKRRALWNAEVSTGALGRSGALSAWEKKHGWSFAGLKAAVAHYKKAGRLA